jgi:hypothetical protein
VLEVQRSVLGEEHPATLGVGGDLALTLRAQGKLEEAKRRQHQVLDIREESLGESSPRTLAAMSHLAATLRAKDDLEAAQKLEQRVLDAQRRVFDEEQPEKLPPVTDLAATFTSPDDFVEGDFVQQPMITRVAPATEVVSRTFHLDLKVDLPVTPGDSFEAHVYAKREGRSRSEQVDASVLESLPDSRVLAIDVWLVTTTHFTITDQPLKTLEIDRSEDRSNTVAFAVQVEQEMPDTDQDPTITALFSQNGRPNGSVACRIPIKLDNEVGAP